MTDKKPKIGNEWQTPAWLFNALNKEFNFKLDVASNGDNKKTQYGLIDGLNQSWSECCMGSPVFCNPPYSKIEPWILKAIEELKNGVISVFLIPSATDTKWFKLCVDHASQINFITSNGKNSGRIKFVDPAKKIEVAGNTSGSCVVIFDVKSQFLNQELKTRFLTIEQIKEKANVNF